MKGKGEEKMRRNGIIFGVFFTFTAIAVAILLPLKAMAQELVLYYPFEEGGGNKVVDKSGKGNDGNFDKGDAKRVPSKEKGFGQAMEFSAKERIMVKESDSLKVDTKVSFAMWVKKANDAGGVGTLPRIISRASDQHELAMDSGHIKRGNFAIYFGGNPGWTSAMPVDLNWHHIVVTFDGGNFKVYLDGESAFELKAGAPRMFTGTLYIASRHDLGSNEHYAGLLDELAIYSGVLDQKKVKEIMKLGVLGQLASVESAGKLPIIWGELKKR